MFEPQPLLLGCARWEAFGWHVLSIDGNSVAAVDEAYRKAKEIKGKPTLIIANTTSKKFSENSLW